MKGRGEDGIITNFILPKDIHIIFIKLLVWNQFSDFEKRGRDFDTFLKYYINFATTNTKNPYPVESKKLVKDLVDWYKLSRR